MIMSTPITLFSNWWTGASGFLIRAARWTGQQAPGGGAQDALSRPSKVFISQGMLKRTPLRSAIRRKEFAQYR